MKFRKKSLDNRGLSLVELIVAVAISAIAIGAIWQFILISTRSYESSKAEAELQQEVQQTMNQVQNLLIDTNKAVAYYYEEADSSYKQISSDYTSPKDASKRLEMYNDNKIAHLTWDKTKKEIVYKEAKKEGNNLPAAADWEEAILAKGVESLAIDVSQVEKKQVLKVKMSFERNNKTYTATRNVALRNSIINTGNADDIYEKPAGNNKPIITISGVTGNRIYQRDSHTFMATITNSTDTTLLWTIQGQESDDTYMNIETGEIVIGATEPKDNVITVIATLESDRTVNGIYQFSVADAGAPIVTIVDERVIKDGNPAIWGGDIEAPIETQELVMSALSGAEYKIPILADVKPAEYSHKWTFVPLEGKGKVDAEVIVERDSSGVLQEYLVVGENQVDDFWLRADVVSNEEKNGFDECYVNVIPPVPLIKVDYDNTSTFENVELYEGTPVSVWAVWKGVIASEDKPFGYTDDILKEHDLEWTIKIFKDDKVINGKDGKGDTYIHPANAKVTEFTRVPYSNADRVEITAKSKKYTNVTFPTLTISLKERELELTGTYVKENEDGTTSTVTLTDQTGNTVVGLYEDITFVPEYTGGVVRNLNWTIDLGDGNPLPLDSSKVGDGSSVTLNTAIDTFYGNRMIGKNVTVTAYDKDSTGVKASVKFKVQGVTECNKTITSLNDLEGETILAEYNYLHPTSSMGDAMFELYGFNYSLANIRENVEYSKVYVVKNDNTVVSNADTNYYMNATTYTENGSDFMRFTPVKNSNSSNIKCIIFDINDIYTKEHLGYIKLNAYTPDHIVKLSYDNSRHFGVYVNKASKNISYNTPDYTSKEVEFVNYYGYDYFDEADSVEYSRKPIKYKYRHLGHYGPISHELYYSEFWVMEFNSSSNAYDNNVCHEYLGR